MKIFAPLFVFCAVLVCANADPLDQDVARKECLTRYELDEAVIETLKREQKLKEYNKYYPYSKRVCVANCIAEKFGRNAFDKVDGIIAKAYATKPRIDAINLERIYDYCKPKARNDGCKLLSCLSVWNPPFSEFFN